MLSIDIETTGLSHLTSYATVACTHDGTGGVCYHLCRPPDEGCTCAGVGPPGEDRCKACRDYHSSNAAALFEALDNAGTICGFNCLRFDIPYLQGKFSLDNGRVGRWAAKTIDLFLLISESFDVFCSLDRALALNGLPRKTGTGAHAVQLAMDARWDDLAEYCMEVKPLLTPHTHSPENSVHMAPQVVTITTRRTQGSQGHSHLSRG